MKFDHSQIAGNLLVYLVYFLTQNKKEVFQDWIHGGARGSRILLVMTKDMQVVNSRPGLERERFREGSGECIGIREEDILLSQ